MNTRIYKIGTQYKTRDKRKNLCTVTDIHRTFNHNGDLVKTSYVSTHEFMGQTITCRISGDYLCHDTSLEDQNGLPTCPTCAKKVIKARKQ